MRKRSSRSRRAGLTLMEVMLVLVILGILGSMAAMFVSSARKDALRKTTKAEIDVLVNAIDRYSLNMLANPPAQDGLQALLERPSSDSNNRWAGPYIKPNNDLKDAWGNPYEYEEVDYGNGQRGILITSAGPDGSVGTDDDVTSDDQF